MRNFHLVLSLVIILAASLSGISQTIDLQKYKSPFQFESIAIYLLNDTSLFNDKQNIAIAEYRKEAFPKYKIDIAYSDSVLKKTSQFGEESKALVALNGGFFDVEKGGSVTYLESDGHVLSRSRNSKEKWAKTDSLLNGAIILDESGGSTTLWINDGKEMRIVNKPSDKSGERPVSNILLIKN